MDDALPILNISTARYECTYGRGCDGICCREGRPLVYPEEIERLDAHLQEFLPAMRAEARKVVESKGYLSNLRRLGQRTLRNSEGWCVFFNRGCILHQLGAADGDKFRYKPAVCSLFPLQRDEHDRWYVRQKGYKSEKWSLFCLDPAPDTAPAVETLAEEIALAKFFHNEAQRTEQIERRELA